MNIINRIKNLWILSGSEVTIQKDSIEIVKPVVVQKQKMAQIIKRQDDLADIIS